MKLVDRWNEAWKWLSVQISAAGALAAVAWAALPDDLKSYIPHRTAAIIAACIFAGAIGGRLISQQKRPS